MHGRLLISKFNEVMISIMNDNIVHNVEKCGPEKDRWFELVIFREGPEKGHWFEMIIVSMALNGPLG